jgi:hypothetical protein
MSIRVSFIVTIECDLPIACHIDLRLDRCEVRVGMGQKITRYHSYTPWDLRGINLPNLRKTEVSW